MRLPFIKMHGCGNDYVFIDCMEWDVARVQSFDASAVARRVSRRRLGIGSDGLVLMLPASGTADARMRMFNADGSEGSLCGNALRCMAMWMHQSGRCGTSCKIEMQNRVIEAVVLSSNADARQATVQVVIGQPEVLTPDTLGLKKYVRKRVLSDVLIDGQPLQLLETSLGNPHAVIFVQSLEALEINRIGPAVERHSLFPDRTNVEFVSSNSPSSASVRVWERGSGETLACGSGACAAVVAGLACDVFRAEVPVLIRMIGGDLTVQFRSDESVSLEGATEESFRGEIHSTALFEFEVR